MAIELSQETADAILDKFEEVLESVTPAWRFRNVTVPFIRSLVSTEEEKGVCSELLSAWNSLRFYIIEAECNININEFDKLINALVSECAYCKGELNWSCPKCTSKEGEE